LFEGAFMPEYLVGTGGWGYFNVPGRSSLKAYSKVFNFVEVNCTFYEYPEVSLVEGLQRTVPKGFVFSVRCHQDLTHRIGLKPTDEAFMVFNRMLPYCRVLDAPFLVLETPSSYVLDSKSVSEAREFFGSVDLSGVRLIWEIRAKEKALALDLMQDLGIVHCVDLSISKPEFESDIVYSRLFGKGRHNIYQFNDEELTEIDQKAKESGAKTVSLSYHGARMFSDASRFLQFKKTGKFLPVTSFVGLDSVRSVLYEDAIFPTSKNRLIADQGWKVVDLTAERRVHLSEVLAKIPDGIYGDVVEVAAALEGKL
jgi:uncharacterized protein YecE (DUF72 family)